MQFVAALQSVPSISGQQVELILLSVDPQKKPPPLMQVSNFSQTFCFVLSMSRRGSALKKVGNTASHIIDNFSRFAKLCSLQ